MKENIFNTLIKRMVVKDKMLQADLVCS
jgi:hypothetical protein